MLLLLAAFDGGHIAFDGYLFPISKPNFPGIKKTTKTTQMTNPQNMKIYIQMYTCTCIHIYIYINSWQLVATNCHEYICFAAAGVVLLVVVAVSNTLSCCFSLTASHLFSLRIDLWSIVYCFFIY